MRMDQEIRLQNLDPTNVKRSLLLGMLLTSLTFYFLDDSQRPYPSCLTDPNFPYHYKNPCYYKQTCTSSIYEMFLPTLMFHIVISLGINKICSDISTFMHDRKEQIYKEKVKALTLEQYIKTFENSDSTIHSARLLQTIKEQGNITQLEGKECVTIPEEYSPPLPPSNITSKNGQTYIFLAPPILKAVKVAIQQREQSKNQPSLALT